MSPGSSATWTPDSPLWRPDGRALGAGRSPKHALSRVVTQRPFTLWLVVYAAGSDRGRVRTFRTGHTEAAYPVYAPPKTTVKGCRAAEGVPAG